MVGHHRSRFQLIALAAAAKMILSVDVVAQPQALDGPVLINQDAALAGGITPGDEPGFPISITREGSYRLAGNIRTTAANDLTLPVILILADNVTLDLMGFVIEGPCVGTFQPTPCSSLQTPYAAVFATGINTAIVNGVVRGTIGPGVQIHQGRIEGMLVQYNRGGGIDAFVDSRVARNIVHHNGGHGIHCNDCIVEGNTVMWNSGSALTGARSAYVSNIFAFNGGVVSADALKQLGGNICGSRACP